jgi:hypothetical protein
MVVALHGHSLTHLLLSCQFNSSDGAFEAELADTFEAQVVPEEYFVCRELWPLPAADEGEDVGPKHHFHYADATIEFCRFRKM